MSLRETLFLALVWTVLSAAGAASEPCPDCPEKGWPVALLPGDLREALPSPDGSRLAVYGGPGVPGREHTVVVLERDCESGEVRVAQATSGAPFFREPEDMPGAFVRLRWSGDGAWLYAPGGLYRVESRDGELTARRSRTLPDPYLSFAFGPGTRAAAVRFLEAGERRARADGQEEFLVSLSYEFVHHTRDLKLSITPREKLGGFWFTETWDTPPWVSWDGEVTVIFYPTNQIYERFQPGKVRETVKAADRRVPMEPGPGPFSSGGDCATTWELVRDAQSDRVRVETGP